MFNYNILFQDQQLLIAEGSASFLQRLWFLICYTCCRSPPTYESLLNEDGSMTADALNHPAAPFIKKDLRVISIYLGILILLLFHPLMAQMLS